MDAGLWCSPEPGKRRAVRRPLSSSKVAGRLPEGQDGREGSAVLRLPPHAGTVRSADDLECVAENGVALLKKVVRAVNYHAARGEDDVADVVEQQPVTGIGLLED